MAFTIARFTRTLVASVILAGGVAGICAPATASAAVPDVRKIATVDMQRVLNESKQGRKARGDLESSSTTKQKKLDKKRVSLEQEQVKLKDLTGERLMAAQEKLQRDYMEWQSMAMTLQQELAEQEARMLEKIYANCQGLVTTLAKEKGLDLVLIRDETTVLFVQSSLDITGELISLYNKKFPK